MCNLYNELLNIVRENIDGLSYDEALDYLDNDAVPVAGNVSGLIYKEDTEKLAREFHDEIIELMEHVGFNKPLRLNAMAWFAWEALILGCGEVVLDDLEWSK